MCYPQSIATKFDCLSFIQQDICPGASWHWPCQTWRKLLAASPESSPVAPATKIWPHKPNTFWYWQTICQLYVTYASASWFDFKGLEREKERETERKNNGEEKNFTSYILVWLKQILILLSINKLHYKDAARTSYYPLKVGLHTLQFLHLCLTCFIVFQSY